METEATHTVLVFYFLYKNRYLISQLTGMRGMNWHCFSSIHFTRWINSRMEKQAVLSAFNSDKIE